MGATLGMTQRVPRKPTSPLVRLVALHLIVAGLSGRAQDVPRTTGRWDPEVYGNHRAVVRLETRADAAWVHIPWRRRDKEPEKKRILLVDARTGSRIANVTPVEIRREFGDLVFQPLTVPGDYHVYYLPFSSTGRHYPKVTYLKSEPTAEAQWLRRHGLTAEELRRGRWKQLPQARLVELQSIDEFHSFRPMEVIATRAEMKALEAAYADTTYLLFPEDRSYPIRMYDDLPLRWIRRGPGGIFRGQAMRGEFYCFQLGVYAMRSSLDDIEVTFGPLRLAGEPTVIPGAAFRCINVGGVDWRGQEFRRQLSVAKGRIQPLWCGVKIPEGAAPGVYEGRITISPQGMEPSTIALRLSVSDGIIRDSGDDEPWRHSRLRWLDSRIALDDSCVEPYTAVEVDGNHVRVLGRRIALGDEGFPLGIESFFSMEMTHLGRRGRQVLAGPVKLVVEDSGGQLLSWRSAGPRVVKRATGVAAWESESRAGPLTMEVRAEIEFDGALEYTVALRAADRLPVRDIRLCIPYARDVARYMMGMGFRGGYRPKEFTWKWDVAKNQDGAWIGDVNAGLQFSLKDERYSRPLNTNFYRLKPLVMPVSWNNSGVGGCSMAETGADAFLVTCFSGPRTMKPGETLRFDFRLLITPFRPIDTRAHFATRFFHAFRPISEIAATGANTINIHHATPINPWINYPFLRPREMMAYIDEAHARDLKVKIYYTVRELSNRAPELFALRSLGDEILCDGPGGGFSWLQEHLGSNYIPGWFVSRLEDAAIINSGVSRWHNYYLEGLDWVARNVGIDGVYIDDVAFDRTVMKRLRRILDRSRPGALIDLHSANQFNPRDGYANSANLYLEHFPYIDRLWFGEYFDYDSPPEFWLTEISGIPFGPMGEMLQDGGNPWRGMLYGMTSRLPRESPVDPRALWKVWDAFGIAESRMVGYWVPDSPVSTGRKDVLATTYLKKGKALVSLASWASESVSLKLAVDWKRLDIDPSKAVLRAPAIRDFQEERSFDSQEALPIAPGRGWLLILEEE